MWKSSIIDREKMLLALFLGWNENSNLAFSVSDLPDFDECSKRSCNTTQYGRRQNTDNYPYDHSWKPLRAGKMHSQSQPLDCSLWGIIFELLQVPFHYVLQYPYFLVSFQSRIPFSKRFPKRWTSETLYSQVSQIFLQLNDPCPWPVKCSFYDSQTTRVEYQK